jgi:hypothetical protein
MGTKHLLINGQQDSDPPSGGNYGLVVKHTVVVSKEGSNA